jgi:hypothetical protein
VGEPYFCGLTGLIGSDRKPIRRNLVGGRQNSHLDIRCGTFLVFIFTVPHFMDTRIERWRTG